MLKYDWVTDSWHDPIDEAVKEKKSSEKKDDEYRDLLRRQKDEIEYKELKYQEYRETIAKEKQLKEEKRKQKKWAKIQRRSMKLSLLGVPALVLVLCFDYNIWLGITGLVLSVIDLVTDLKRDKRHWPAIIALLIGIPVLLLDIGIIT